jgi:hypothetical protein
LTVLGKDTKAIALSVHDGNNVIGLHSLYTGLKMYSDSLEKQYLNCRLESTSLRLSLNFCDTARQEAFEYFSRCKEVNQKLNTENHKLKKTNVILKYILGGSLLLNFIFVL